MNGADWFSLGAILGFNAGVFFGGMWFSRRHRDDSED